MIDDRDGEFPCVDKGSQILKGKGSKQIKVHNRATSKRIEKHYYLKWMSKQKQRSISNFRNC